MDNQPQKFDPDSKYLYFLSDDGAEFKYIARHELATGEREIFEKASWDIFAISFSRNGKYRVVVMDEDARTKVKVTEVATNKPLE